MSNNIIKFIKKNHVGSIILNQPETGNFIDLAMAQALEEICQRINQDDEIHVVLLAAYGDVFCMGGECSHLKQAGDELSLMTNLSAIELVAAIDRPVIASINGEARGEGLEMILACDLRIASEKAQFSLPQICQGYIPVEGGTQRLARIVGRGKALEMVLTGEVIDAATALEIGLVNRVVAAEKIWVEAEALADTIASKAPIALRYSKEAVNTGLDMTLEQGLRLEADLYFILHTTNDRTEGVKSFLEKRSPQFKGN